MTKKNPRRPKSRPEIPHEAADGFTLNHVRLIRAGAPFFEMLDKLIAEAADTIYIQVYVFDDDETGTRVANALKLAAGRKVHVYVLADGYASQSLPKSFIQEMTDAGVQFRYFQPLFKSERFYFGRRMHHKVFVFDGKYALVGGMNIADRYNDLPDDPAWLDFALMVQGPAARELCAVCHKNWKANPKYTHLSPCEAKEEAQAIEGLRPSPVRVIRNDWVQKLNQITFMYNRMFASAESSITIVCSYFLPNIKMRETISRAVRRGVKVRVIFAGYSDVAIVKSAERWLYDWLWRNHIEFYEYQPSVLHAKLAFSDDEWITVGSYNLNKLSAYASIELNLVVKDRELVAETEKMLDDIIRNDCVLISKEKYSHSRNIFIRFLRWLSYVMFNILFAMGTFYYRQKE